MTTGIPSSQRHFGYSEKFETVSIMVGIVVYVYPSDDKGNEIGGASAVSRGSRHECDVYAGHTYGDPDTPLQNVVITPDSNSGLDNFSDYLPRGITGATPGTVYNPDFQGVNIATLDGDWCVVGFVGGRLDRPVMLRWWPHPANKYDMITSGQGNDGTALTQVEKQKSRRMFRFNGTLFVINREGSLYVDTTEACRTVELQNDGLPKVSQVEKGGHLQVDVKQKATFEINWNDKTRKPKGAAIGVTSDSLIEILDETIGADAPVHDPDLPHADQPIDSTTPEPRPTERTLIKGKEYEVIAKTSKLMLVARTDGGVDGEVDMLVDKLIKLKCGEDVVVHSPKIHIGSAESAEQLVCGNLWIAIMEELVEEITQITVATPVGPSVAPVINKAKIDAILQKISDKEQVSDFVWTQKEPPE